MLNQRLLAALLAVTTVTTTVAVNVSPSYGNPAGSADDVVVQGGRTFRRVWDYAKRGWKLVEITSTGYGAYQAGEAAKKWYDNRQQPPQYQQPPQSGNRYITPENAQRVFDYHYPNR